MWFELILTAIFFLTFWFYTKRPSNYPPGVWGLPVIGYIPFGISNFHGRMEELHKKYGDIFCWKLGSRILIFIYDYNMMKEAFQSHAFSNRPENIKTFLTVVDSDEPIGVLATNGIRWTNIRRFMLRHLRDLGMGKSKLASAIHYEALELVKVMKQQAGRAAPVPRALSPAVINVLWQMVADQRYELDDKKVVALHDSLRKLQDGGMGVAVLEIFPWLRNIFPEVLLDKLLKKHIFTEVSDGFKMRFKEDIDSHIETLDENNSRDFIDDYLIEMEKQKSDPDSTMSIKDLVGCLADLLAAGLETTTHTLIFCIFYLANFPEIQSRLHKEIDDVLPGESQATLNDRPKLPYTEAFIHEVLRFSSRTAFGVMHSVLTDTVLSEYTIPKGALIFQALGYVHSDPKYFESPNEFRPDRFMNSEGKFQTPKEGFLPFGIGKRQCLGESLARMQLLIFLTTFVQHLKFSVPPGKEIDLSPQDLPLFHMPRTKQDVLISIRK